MTIATQDEVIAAASVEEPLSVNISRVFRAQRQRVFEAWIKPEQMLVWRGPEGWKVLEAESDPRPGGEHRAVVRGTPPDRSEEVTGASWGKYLDVEPYSLLRFTWAADWAPDEESMVTVRLSDAEGGGTLMDFVHDRFATAQSANGHTQGWTSAFRKLVALLEQ